jgi:signal transduction histidine kinase
MDIRPADKFAFPMRFGDGNACVERERTRNDILILDPAETSESASLLVGLMPLVGATIESGTDELFDLTLPGSVLRSDVQRASHLSKVAVLKADFTAMVAHELTSPLAAIRTLVAMLATGELPPEEQSQALATIAAQTDVLQTLVADLETTATAERDDFAVRLHPVPIIDLLIETAAFNRTLPGEHPMTTLIASAHRVLADRERIGQVLRNLIENAAKFSPIGAPIELRATLQERRMRIQVADRGRGIPPHDLLRIFEKFGRGRDERGQRVPGVGLGLYLSRRLVQMHGSELTVEPRPGGGSTFTFELEVVR